MKPPDRETTRQALDDWEGLLASAHGIAFSESAMLAILKVNVAAEAWSRIAPDTTGEWSEEVVEPLMEIYAYELYGETLVSFTTNERKAVRDATMAVLVEIVRLAEGSDDPD